MEAISSASTALVDKGAGFEPAPDGASSGSAPSGSASSGSAPSGSGSPDRGPTAADTSSAQSLHHLTVVTPEGVVLDFRAAGVASRTLAKGIDLLIQFVALIAAIFLAAFMIIVSEAFAVVTIVITIFLIFYGYSAVLETWWDGKTVGKKLFGIKVITTEGGPVRFRHAAIRSMIATFDFFFPTPGGLIAVFFALLTKRSQRLGDLAAGTIVIREPKASRAPVFFAPVFGSEAFAANLDTSRLDPRQYTLVREFLLRAHELTPEARAELAEQMAHRVAVQTGNAKPVSLDGERYLVAVLHAHQGRFSNEALPGPQALPHPQGPPQQGPPQQGPPPGRFYQPPPGGAPGPAVARPGVRPGPVDLQSLAPPTGPPVGPR